MTLGLCVIVTLPALSACGSDRVIDARYYWGHEVNVVCPCSTDTCFWVNSPPELQKVLKRYVQTQTSSVYQPVLLRFEGRLLQEQPIGFAVNYDGLMRIDRIEELSTEIPSSCADPERASQVNRAATPGDLHAAAWRAEWSSL
jgi:hypothetical protein